MIRPHADQIVDQAPFHQRSLCYAAIVRIVMRYEFDLCHVSAPPVLAQDAQLQRQVSMTFGNSAMMNLMMELAFNSGAHFIRRFVHLD